MADQPPLPLRLLFALGGALAPRSAARAAAGLISRPRGRNPPQPWEKDTQPPGTEVEWRPGQFALAWGGDEGPLVLAMHGWRGRTTQFRRLAALLIERGLRLVVLDAPGHGRSEGSRATPTILGGLLADCASRLGPVHAFVGHSLGGAAIGPALLAGMQLRRIAVLASPSRVSRMPPGFARQLWLPGAAIEELERMLDEHAGRPAAELDLVATLPRLAGRVLIVHDADDDVIPWAEAQALHEAWPAMQLLQTRGLGHRGLLADAAVLRAVAAFVAEDAA